MNEDSQRHLESHIERWSIRVIGRVQGVYFRKSTQETANQLGIKGYVENQFDGSVFIEAEGNLSVLHKFKAWCMEGPPLAKVEKLEVEAMKKLANDQDFQIRY